MTRALSNYHHEEILAELRARELVEENVPRLARLRCRGQRVPRALVSCRCREVREEIGLVRFETDELINVVRTTQALIYGVDNRTELFEVIDPHIQWDASGVVAVVDASRLSANGDGTFTLSGASFRSEYALCDHEAFGDQPSIALCSGFLADPTIVVTAGHCIDASALASTRFVFGYEMVDALTPRTRILAADVVSGIRLIGRQELSGGGDWAVVQLERPILHRPCLPIRRAGSLPLAAPLHVIGHPAGLPKKYAPGAEVRHNGAPAYFVANLDTYGGNSGSPVFHAESHEVEGVLVRGEVDFLWTGSCYVSNVCPADGCRGEDCTRASEFAHLIPQPHYECVNFDPALARVERTGASWQVWAGATLLRDFGDREGDAKRALEIVHHYQLNAQCLIGRTSHGAAMEFYLSNGAPPSGPMSDDDCIGFDPAALEVLRGGGRWRIADDSHWLLDFDQDEGHARLALSLILRYQFRYICFIGKPDASLTYLRV